MVTSFTLSFFISVCLDGLDYAAIKVPSIIGLKQQWCTPHLHFLSISGWLGTHSAHFMLMEESLCRNQKLSKEGKKAVENLCISNEILILEVIRVTFAHFSLARTITCLIETRESKKCNHIQWLESNRGEMINKQHSEPPHCTRFMTLRRKINW